MDFQGQGLADSGETEALAILDSFTKTAMVIPLPNRNAYTLAPALLNELYFRRGAPDILHSDAAPEFLSHLMTAIHMALSTTRKPRLVMTLAATVNWKAGGGTGITACDS
jgi:transposase InsO family protein